MYNINHYEANFEFHLLYSEIENRFAELDAFLKHIHKYVSVTEGKLGSDLKMYSSDFFEYYYAGSYGETFRSSLIVSVASVSESYLKNYIHSMEKSFGS